MSRVILLIFLSGFFLLSPFSDSVYAQQSPDKSNPSIRISGRAQSILSTFDKTQDIPLLDSNSEIAGSYRPETIQGEKKFRVMPQNGNSFLIDPLQFTVLSGDQKRLLAYGAHFELCTFSNLLLKIYTGSGDLIKSFDSGIHWPYTLAMGSNSDFIIAGKKGYENTIFVIRKYSDNGEVLWEKPIPSDIPSRIVLSPKTQYSSIIQYNEQTRTRSLLIFDNAGNQIYHGQLKNPLSEMEFITDDKIVVYSAHKWYLYNISNGIELIAGNILRGNPIGNHPVSASVDGLHFVIATSTSQKDGYLLQIYNVSDGKFIGESYYAGHPNWQAYRIARMPEPGKIELLAEDEVVVFSLN